jgi:hypothetical protein
MPMGQQQSFEYSNTTFPPLSPQPSLQSTSRQGNESLSNDQQSNKPLYSAAYASKNKNNVESIVKETGNERTSNPFILHLS